jgi:putative membrane protein
VDVAQPSKSLAAVVYPGFVAGLALFTALLVRHGVGEVGAAVVLAGSGLVWVALFHLLPMFADALGWRCLLPAPTRPPFRTILLGRWLGESVNTLLPAMQVGGNLVKARFLTRRGVPGATAGASVVVDVTLLVLSQMLFTVIGLGLLLARLRGTLAAPVLVGMAMMGTLLTAFYLFQRKGLFGLLAGVLGRIGRGSDWTALTTSAAALDTSVKRLYGNPPALVAAGTLHFVSWVIGAGEVWLALYVLGHPVGLLTALMLESLGQAVRAAAFVVPGALGVQEGGYLVLGSALGLAPETALALSLTKRVRELLLGVPGLIVWQLEGTGTVPAVAVGSASVEGSR